MYFNPGADAAGGLARAGYTRRTVNGTTWYPVRHGETEWNATARMQGQRDSGLTPHGREEARVTADLIVRARAFLTDVVSTTAPGERVALVAHGFLNRALATVLLDQQPADMLGISQDNDTLMRIVVQGGVSVADYFESGQGPIAGLPMTAPRPSLA
jgi:broad specificity phosphatase PhoE